MNTVDIEATVGELVMAAPSRAEAFQQLGIDYCCSGSVHLSEVCHRKGLDLATVVQMLDASDELSLEPKALTLSQLCDQIEHEHHVSLRDRLLQLEALARAVVNVHGISDPRWSRLGNHLFAFGRELRSVMEMESAEIFPLVRRIDKATEGGANLRDQLRRSVGKMKERHGGSAKSFALFRGLSNAYTPPERSSQALKDLCAALRDLETEVRQAAHKRNNVLLPRALAIP